MHNLMLVTITMSPGATSQDARLRVYSELVADPSFCGEAGRFGSPLADWFVIGGRCSGYLSSTAVGADAVQRDADQDYGSEDDAMLVDRTLYDRFLAICRREPAPNRPQLASGFR
jgi:phage terminase large subunit-like protein